MLKIEHLTKTYGDKKAVDDLTLHIEPGQICGFIGHNGAGKTTTLKACCGILKPDAGTITVDGKCYEIGHREALYVGKEAKDVVFASIDGSRPAKFYYNCAPAHSTYPTKKVTTADVAPVTLGDNLTSNRRTIYKYLVPDVLPTCQLVMGMTKLEPGSVWNTMPCHTHDRRMEVYLYFDMPEDAFVMHFMGEGQETRHIIMRNEQAVISPSWRIHSGCGTQAYTFIWGMCGENQDFDDMDGIAMKDLK